MVITKLWKTLPGKYFCISTRDAFKKWEDHFFKKSEFNDIPEFIEENMHKDIYFCPHGFSKPRRLKECAVIPALLWADLDEVNPSDLGKLTPSIAWESSPGRYAAIWKIDDFMTEDLNRRLSSHLGADMGGWDITQVLRVPGTKNYKYTSSPKVKLLWSDGESFKIDRIEKIIPREIRKTKVDGDAFEIYKRYEKKFNTFIRKELLNGKPVEGKRSEVIWKLVNEIVEAGCSSDEAFELLRISPWNKFKNRRDGDAQLKREIDKALSQHIQISVDGKSTFEEEDQIEEDEERQPHIFLSKSMDQYDEEEVDWLWYPYIARQEVTILEGDPGLGKSYLAQMIAKAIVQGEKLPSPKNRGKAIKGKIAYFDIENHPGSVTKKRLVLNGCTNLQDYFQDTEPFSVDDEETLKRVHRAIENLKPALVVFDTINIYIGGADTNKSSEVQQAFKHFVDIARRHNCAVLVLRHLTKSTKEKALYRGQGSIAFTGLARVVITCGLVPESVSDDPEMRVICVTKINITKPPKALLFAIRELPDTLNQTDRSLFEWGSHVDLTADEVVSPYRDPNGTEDKKTKEQDIHKFLEELLEGGPMKTDAILRAAEARSISRRLLYKVAEEMNVIPDDKKRVTGWRLPPSKKRTKE